MKRLMMGLFDSVLGISDPPEAWLLPWVDRAEKAADPLLVVEEFISHKASLERREHRDDTRTRWPTGHFYSPVVSRKEASDDWERISHRPVPENLDLNANGQRVLFDVIKQYFHTMPHEDIKNEIFRYYFINPSYNFGDALIYWSMINHLRPKRIIEIGSGFSSALALDTIDALGLPTTCTFIDPFPAVAEAATAPLHPRHNIVPQRIQDVDLRLFDELGHNDILFIDSSHIVKTGSDVHFEITEILPRLGRGVVVHFHDMFYPFEYPRDWVIARNHSWNEAYFLHAFLMFNLAYEIVFFNHFVAQQMKNEIVGEFPIIGRRFLINPGGGLWLRRQR